MGQKLPQGHGFAGSSKAWIEDALDVLFLRVFGVTKTHVLLCFLEFPSKHIVSLPESIFLDGFLRNCCGGPEISRSLRRLQRQTLICRK